MKNLFFVFLFMIPELLLAQAGSLDSTFGGNGIILSDTSSTFYAEDLVVQPDGKIVIGTFGFHSTVERFNPDGSIDSSFNGGSSIHTSSYFGIRIARSSDGKILTAFVIFDELRVSQYNSDGSVDTAFASQGTVATTLSGTGWIKRLIIQPDNKIQVLVRINSYLTFLRFNENGSPDSSFGIGGIVSTGVYSGFAADEILLADGKIIMAAYSYPISILRYNQNGSIDSTYGINGEVNYDKMHNSLFSKKMLAEQPDGKILLMGNDTIGINNNFTLARFNEGGSVDSSFGENGLVITETSSSDSVSGSANAISLQADGKILVAGVNIENGINPSSGGNHVVVVRYTNSGLPDSSFDSDGIAIVNESQYGYERGYCMAIQPDGKIVIGGSASNSVAIFRFISGLSVGIDESAQEKNSLQIYPNPFSSSANISFSLRENSTISLEVFNLLGQKVKALLQNENQSPGNHQYSFTPPAEGIYFVKLTVDGISYSQKIICQK